MVILSSGRSSSKNAHRYYATDVDGMKVENPVKVEHDVKKMEGDCKHLNKMPGKFKVLRGKIKSESNRKQSIK